MKAFFETLATRARQTPHQPAIVTVNTDGTCGATVAYGELWHRITSAASWVSSQTSPGEAVLVILPNGFAYVSVFLGVLLSGRVVYPLHPQGSDSEKSTAVFEARARLIVDSQTCPPDLMEPLLTSGPEPDPGSSTGFDLETSCQGALLLRSSGTTGLPKLVRRDAHSLDAVARNTAETIQLSPGDRVLAAIPLSHSYGIENGLLAPLLAGATVHVMQGFDPVCVLKQWRDSRVTVMPVVPFMVEMLAHTSQSIDCTSIRCVYSAGATLPRPVHEAFQSRFGLSVGQLYGATEIGSVTFNHPTRLGFDPGSVGLPMAGVRIKILDPADPHRALPIGQEGQVAVRAASMLSRYESGEALQLIDGYFQTGDLGRLDSEGALSLTGRLKLLIDIGGMKVNPLEVEAVLREHSAVGECVVVPTPVSNTLSRLKAYVMLTHRATENELKDFVRDRLSAFKVPRSIEVLDAMPRSATGKVLRQQLIERAGR